MLVPRRVWAVSASLVLLLAGSQWGRAAVWQGDDNSDLLTASNWSTNAVPVTTGANNGARNADFDGTATSFAPVIASGNLNPRLFRLFGTSSYTFSGDGTITIGGDDTNQKYLDAFGMTSGTVTLSNGALDINRGGASVIAGVGGSQAAGSNLIINTTSFRMGLGAATSGQNIIWTYGNSTSQQPNPGGDVTVNPTVNLSAIQVDQPLSLSSGGNSTAVSTVALHGGITGHASLTTNVRVNIDVPVGNGDYVSLTGRVVIGGTSNFVGTTTVGNGTLLINGNYNGTGAVTVDAPATLGGTGTIGSDLIANGTISPGTSIDTLSVIGNVALNGTLFSEVSGSTADLLAVTGNLTLDAASTLDLPLGNTYDPGTTYDLITFTGGLTGGFGSFSGVPNTHTLEYLTNSVSLVPVPEPAGMIIFGIGSVGLLCSRRACRQRVVKK